MKEVDGKLTKLPPFPLPHPPPDPSLSSSSPPPPVLLLHRVLKLHRKRTHLVALPHCDGNGSSKSILLSSSPKSSSSSSSSCSSSSSSSSSRSVVLSVTVREEHLQICGVLRRDEGVSVVEGRSWREGREGVRAGWREGGREDDQVRRTREGERQAREENQTTKGGKRV